MTAPTPNQMPHKVLAQVHEGLNTFDDLYSDGIDDIAAIWRELRWETGVDDDTAAAILALAVYQVNAPDPEDAP